METYNHASGKIRNCDCTVCVRARACVCVVRGHVSCATWLVDWYLECLCRIDTSWSLITEVMKCKLSIVLTTGN
jgi:hypothetical protein